VPKTIVEPPGENDASSPAGTRERRRAAKGRSTNNPTNPGVSTSEITKLIRPLLPGKLAAAPSAKARGTPHASAARATLTIRGITATLNKTLGKPQPLRSGYTSAMPEMSSYPPGTPCWIDLAAPDIDAAKSFYGGLFGWESQEVGSTEETRGYHFFTLNGKLVAGFGPPGEGEPPSWRSYVAVEDAGETAGKAKEAGGEVLLDSTEVLDVGRMAVFRDTEGAVICAWQPARHHGAELANEPGAFSWAELATRDPDAAKSFYSAVFGWNTVDREMGPITYVELQVDGRAVGGMLPLTEGPRKRSLRTGSSTSRSTTSTARWKSGRAGRRGRSPQAGHAGGIVRRPAGSKRRRLRRDRAVRAGQGRLVVMEERDRPDLDRVREALEEEEKEIEEAMEDEESEEEERPG
jgi:predicted enzyme related to lactoylglutathione lyase